MRLCFSILWIKNIVVTASAEYIDFVEKLVIDNKFQKVHVTEGGPVRHKSIFNGIKALRKGIVL